MKYNIKPEASAEWAPDGLSRSLTLCSSVFGLTLSEKDKYKLHMWTLVAQENHTPPLLNR